MITQIILIITFIIIYCRITTKRCGHHSTSVNQNSEDAHKLLRQSQQGIPLNNLQKVWKATLNALTLRRFNSWKMSGIITSKKAIGETSRGYMKLESIMRQANLRPKGKVLSLACGPGGWEQWLAERPSIEEIVAITLGSGPGHEGHANFTTEYWPGKEKVTLIYGDITRVGSNYNLTKELPVWNHQDWVFFDGGEQHSNPETESSKFNKLLREGVMPHIKPHLKGFCLKILTPLDEETQKLIKQIQDITGMGDLIRSEYSRSSNLEMYLVSTPKRNLAKRARELFNVIMEKVKTGKLTIKQRKHKEVQWQQHAYQLKPLDTSQTMRSLGQRLMEPPNHYNHWISKGVYPFGIDGSNVTPRNMVVWNLISRVAPFLNRFMEWEGTDNTPTGFNSVFRRKVDTTPIEKSPEDDALKAIYRMMSTYFKGRVRTRPYSDKEIQSLMNRQGAPSVTDKWLNVGEFLDDPGRFKVIEKLEKELMQGKCSLAYFRAVGKREKKKNGKKGSRVVDYLPIPMRYLEVKYLGTAMDLVNPDLNHGAVSKIGLHDLGMVLKERWRGAACNDDIAGFDTRISCNIMSMEWQELLEPLGFHPIAKALYRLYCHPLLLIPRISEYHRSELLQGMGQRMSGEIVTYSMNTMTALATAILRWLRAMGIPVEEWNHHVKLILSGKHPRVGFLQSGDDGVVTGPYQDMTQYSKEIQCWNSLGMIRKDTPLLTPSPVKLSMDEVEFCSHKYSEVSYYDSWNGTTVTRYMPVREVSEIMAKATIWMRFQPGDMNEQAWASAQANNLFVNYHTIRDVRRLALAIKSCVNIYVTLVAVGFSILGRPWMREGELLDVTNTCLFGESTRYPVPGFACREMKHLGYIKISREKNLNAAFDSNQMKGWRRKLWEQIQKNRRNTTNTIDIYSEYYDRQ
uniref:RdRp n=1 Tax=Erysiphe necator associated ssRNA virus 3 TaxID=2695361 RepID=A0A7U3MF05_9VIRU|nr:RdRp [Erysiphe necator associated ssRNA virus 3]